jgi:hypothetical protein
MRIQAVHFLLEMGRILWVGTKVLPPPPQLQSEGSGHIRQQKMGRFQTLDFLLDMGRILRVGTQVLPPSSTAPVLRIVNTLGNSK